MPDLDLRKTAGMATKIAEFVGSRVPFQTRRQAVDLELSK
jgi:hypothetical protein